MMQYKRCHNLKVLYVINDQPNEWNYTDVNLTDCFVPSTDVWSSSKATTWRIEKSKTTRMLHNTWCKHDTPYTGPKNVRNGSYKSYQDLCWRSTPVHSPLFCAHTLCVNYVTETLLLASSSVNSKNAKKKPNKEHCRVPIRRKVKTNTITIAIIT